MQSAVIQLTACTTMLTKTLLSEMLRMSATVADCHVQCCDEASNEWYKEGVAAIIMQEERRAIHTHTVMGMP